jgi:hypothetical protein
MPVVLNISPQLTDFVISAYEILFDFLPTLIGALEESGWKNRLDFKNVRLRSRAPDLQPSITGVFLEKQKDSMLTYLTANSAQH